MIYHLPKLRELTRTEFSQQTSSGFVSDSEIDAWINEAYYKYVMHLMMASQGHFDKTTYLSFVANTEAITLPNNFANVPSLLSVVRVERILSNARVPLMYRRRYDEAVATGSVVAGYSYIPTYDFRGQSLILEPTPGSSETNGLFMVYKALPPKLQSANCGNTGGATSIVLDSTADERDDYYNGCRIMITSGPDAGNMGKITDYDGGTKTATTDVSFAATTTSSVFSLLIDDDFPEHFHDLLYLYAAKRAFQKERSMGTSRAYDANTLKERETEFFRFTEKKTDARTQVQPWNIEIMA